MDEGDEGSSFASIGKSASSPMPDSSFEDLSLPSTSVHQLRDLERGGGGEVIALERLGYEERRKKIGVDVEVFTLNEPAAAYFLQRRGYTCRVDFAKI